MLDVRTGIALESSVNDKFVALCEELKISRGEFLTAMLTELPQDTIAQAVEARKQIIAARKDERATLRKAKQKLVRSLSVEELQKIVDARAAA